MNKICTICHQGIFTRFLISVEDKEKVTKEEEKFLAAENKEKAPEVGSNEVVPLNSVS